MIISMPVDEQKLESTICISYGRAPYFLIYDTETDQHVFIENAAANSQGGAGIKAAQILVDENVSVLITPRCGENAAEVFNAAGVKIYQSNGKSIIENINAFKTQALSILSEVHAGLHHHA